MKVCYIAPYRDGTGYSKAAIEYILSLDAIGVDVVPRPIRMTASKGEIPDRIRELEQNNVNNVDCVIQHNLPSELSYQNGVMNVAVFAYETSHFQNTTWKYHLELMDKIVVFCHEQVDAIKTTFGDGWEEIKDKVHIVPHAVDVDKFNQKYEYINFGLPKDCLKFYAIGECNHRKNYPALILSYCQAFSSHDNVALIIKSHILGANKNDTIKHFTDLINNIKANCRKFTNNQLYPKIILLADYMSDKDIMRLHKTGDVYCCSSRGESWNLPCTDALGMGNFCITTSCGAFKDYMRPEFGRLISAQKSCIFGEGMPNDLYYYNEHWYNIYVDELSETMKDIYTKNIDIFDETQKIFRCNFVQKYLNRTVIGNSFKEILNAN